MIFFFINLIRIELILKSTALIELEAELIVTSELQIFHIPIRAKILGETLYCQTSQKLLPRVKKYVEEDDNEENEIITIKLLDKNIIHGGQEEEREIGKEIDRGAKVCTTPIIPIQVNLIFFFLKGRKGWGDSGKKTFIFTFFGCSFIYRRPAPDSN